MSVAVDIKLLVLIAIANTIPIVLNRILGRMLSYPVDCRLKLADGEPLFGHSKSIRGVLLALIATSIAAPLLGLAWSVGLLIGALSMLGDLCSSFAKRRMKLPPSSMAIVLDQLPESLFPVLGWAALFGLAPIDMAAVVLCFFLCEIIVSRLLFRWHLRDRPY